MIIDICLLGLTIVGIGVCCHLRELCEDRLDELLSYIHTHHHAEWIRLGQPQGRCVTFPDTDRTTGFVMRRPSAGLEILTTPNSSRHALMAHPEIRALVQRYRWAFAVSYAAGFVCMIPMAIWVARVAS